MRFPEFGRELNNLLTLKVRLVSYLEVTLLECTTYQVTLVISRVDKQGISRNGRVVIQEFVDNVGLCVTVTETSFLFSYGAEVGYLIGFINYPRFPKTPTQIDNLAILLGEKLKAHLDQTRYSIIYPDRTVTYE